MMLFALVDHVASLWRVWNSLLLTRVWGFVPSASCQTKFLIKDTPSRFELGLAGAQIGGSSLNCLEWEESQSPGSELREAASRAQSTSRKSSARSPTKTEFFAATRSLLKRKKHPKMAMAVRGMQIMGSIHELSGAQSTGSRAFWKHIEPQCARQLSRLGTAAVYLVSSEHHTVSSQPSVPGSAFTSLSASSVSAVQLASMTMEALLLSVTSTRAALTQMSVGLACDHSPVCSFT